MEYWNNGLRAEKSKAASTKNQIMTKNLNYKKSENWGNGVSNFVLKSNP
jgi:hypothetical protein